MEGGRVGNTARDTSQVHIAIMKGPNRGGPCALRAGNVPYSHRCMEQLYCTLPAHKGRITHRLCQLSKAARLLPATAELAPLRWPTLTQPPTGECTPAPSAYAQAELTLNEWSKGHDSTQSSKQQSNRHDSSKHHNNRVTDMIVSNITTTE